MFLGGRVVFVFFFFFFVGSVKNLRSQRISNDSSFLEYRIRPFFLLETPNILDPLPVTLILPFLYLGSPRISNTFPE